MKKHPIRHILLAVLVVLALAVSADTKFFTIYRNGNITFETLAKNVDSIAFTSSGRVVHVYGPGATSLFSGLRSAIDSIVFNSYESYPKFNLTSGNELTISRDNTTTYYTINTTGSDPYVYTYALTSKLPDDYCVLTFSYLCPQGVNDLQVFFCDPVTETRSQHMGGLSATTGNVWKTFSYNIKTQRANFAWGNVGNRLRMDFGTSSDVNIQIRALHIRKMTEAEKVEQDRADSIEAAKEKIATHIQTYLATNFTSAIDTVGVGLSDLLVKGTCPAATGNYALVEITPDEDVTELVHFPNRTDLTDTNFSVTLPRKITRGTILYDRILSKWAIVKVKGDTDSLCSHARYADDVTPTYSAKADVLKNKKGVGAGGGDTYISDMDSLGLGSITSNMVLSSIIYTSAGSGRSTYVYGNKTYYIDMNAVAGYDNLYKAAYKRGVVVSAIILTPTGSIFNDPENTGGYYTMPNMTTPDAVNLYAAALNFIARRYSTGTYGRIDHWIMHNEVDMGSDWTNMGSQPEMRFYDRYMKSMRICYNIVRQYDQNASILGSYTHNWNISGDEFSPKHMLEQNVQYSACEGDFHWGVAYHPYPIDLTAPAFWVNDKNQATFTKNSKYVTFYNPEVINDWILDKTHYYKDGTKRILFFSEQGTNSPSYSASDLALQAAGAAWMWKKISKLDGIDAMQWHNWADNRQEFGLRIGLRAFAEGSYTDLQPKPVWYVWKAAGTDKENTVFSPYLSTIGISSWDNIIQTVK